MKKGLAKFTFVVIISTSWFIASAQGTTRFEIWGWKGDKEDFIKLYKDSTGTDLNYAYTCMVDLAKLGYKHSASLIYVDDIEEFKKGPNWDSVERIAIIRQIAPSRPVKLANKSKTQKRIDNILTQFDSKKMDSIETQLENDPAIKRTLLLGSLSSNEAVRSNCVMILENCHHLTISNTRNNIDLLGSMLSFPFPSTAELAMKLIDRSTLPEESNRSLFSQHALTVSDFLNSDLRSFRVDATQFLKRRFPNEKSDDPKQWGQF